MSLLEALQALERVRRRPADLEAEAKAHPVLLTLDPTRLSAVSESFAKHVLGRWWQPRFGASFAHVADPVELAVALIADDAFESAVGEDETAGVLIRGVLARRQAGALRAPDWLEDLLTYEYLLAVGLPRRAEGLAVDEEAEARLFADRVRWLEGGRLARPLAIGSFAVDVGALREDLEPEDPYPVAFGYDKEGALEVPLSHEAVSALELLAEGASDAVLDDAFGLSDGTGLRGVLRELGFLA